MVEWLPAPVPLCIILVEEDGGGTPLSPAPDKLESDWDTAEEDMDEGGIEAVVEGTECAGGNRDWVDDEAVTDEVATENDEF